MPCRRREMHDKLNDYRPPSVDKTASPTPVSALKEENASTPSEPVEHELFLKWITKVEDAKGASARRAAIQAALLVMADRPDQRRRFAEESARIEVRATLDKVDSLKTASAKLRHLNDAIAHLKSDPVPDELQAAELKMLEDALREIR